MRLATRWPRAGVARPHRRHQPVPHVVRDADRILLVLERDHRDDRPEDLLLRDRHRAFDSGEHGRRIERALAVADRSAGDDLGAFLASLLDEAVDLVAVRGRDQRADLRLRIERIADTQLLRERGELRDEVVVDRPLDEHARARLAALPGGVVDRPHRARDRVVEIRVGEDEIRALAAELERDPLDRPRREPHDLAAGLRRAGERNLVDARMTNEIRAGRLARTGNDVDRTGREADLGRELPEPERGQRRRLVGLQHDGAPGGKSGRELPGRHHQRVVPRDDLAGDADRLLQRIEEQRAADLIRAAGDRRDRRRRRSGSSRRPGSPRP